MAWRPDSASYVEASTSSLVTASATRRQITPAIPSVRYKSFWEVVYRVANSLDLQEACDSDSTVC